MTGVSSLAARIERLLAARVAERQKVAAEIASLSVTDLAARAASMVNAAEFALAAGVEPYPHDARVRAILMVAKERAEKAGTK